MSGAVLELPPGFLIPADVRGRARLDAEHLQSLAAGERLVVSIEAQ